MIIVGITVTEVIGIQTVLLQATSALMASRLSPTPEMLDLTWSWASHPPAERCTLCKTHTTWILFGHTVTQKNQNMSLLQHFQRLLFCLNNYTHALVSERTLKTLEHKWFTKDFLLHVTILTSGLWRVVSYTVGQNKPLKSKSPWNISHSIEKTRRQTSPFWISAHWRLVKMYYLLEWSDGNFRVPQWGDWGENAQKAIVLISY